ncbi:MAG TPA: PRC-barrel domain-containing protein, partial [bacterium]|nr:PRC-barrel domain-containing protein [bacterium]
GDFCITTENSSSVVPLGEMQEQAKLLEKGLSIVGAKIITQEGELIGEIKEYSILARTGRILGMQLRSDAKLDSPDRNVIPADYIETIGKDIIIVKEDALSALCSSHEEALALATDGVVPVPKPRPVAAPKPAPAPAPKPAPAPVFEPEPIPEPAVIEEESVAASGIDASSDVDIEELLDLDSAAESAGLVEEPASSDEGEESKQSLSEIFERRQIKYMLGKRVSKDVVGDDGSLVVGHGETITDSVVQKAKASGKFLELSMNIEIED